jgi:NADH-quinone oxidoreductase subunit G
MVHPDGRLQRLRSAIGNPGEVRAGWWVLADISKRIGLDAGVLTGAMAFARLTAKVPFYRGLTLDEIGGRGVRWPARQEAEAMPAGATPTDQNAPGRSQQPPDGQLRLGTYRPIWAAPEVELSPSLHYTIARQMLELSPEDARRLRIGSGDRVTVSQNGIRLGATAHVRTGVPTGTAFLAEGIAQDSANALTGATITVEGGSNDDHMGKFPDQQARAAP